MFVVPLAGDIVETSGGVKHTVLSYAPYKNAPAVYVEVDEAKTKSVSFAEINSINGTPATLTPGKVFNVASRVKRKIQLPQVGDKVKVNGVVLKVKNLKLHERGNLTAGMQLVGEHQDTREGVTVRLADIENLERANGDTDFSRRLMLAVYSEYIGTRQTKGAK